MVKRTSLKKKSITTYSPTPTSRFGRKKSSKRKAADVVRDRCRTGPVWNVDFNAMEHASRQQQNGFIFLTPTNIYGSLQSNI